MEKRVPAGLLTRRDADAVFDRCAAFLDSLAQDREVNGSGVVHLLVLDPAIDGPGFKHSEVLGERSYGLPARRWDADYAAFARAKADLSWRHRCDGRAVQALAPQRLRDGDSAAGGSVYLDGLVVAASGCAPEYDEVAASLVAVMLRARARRKLAAMRGPFIGSDSGAAPGSGVQVKPLPGGRETLINRPR